MYFPQSQRHLRSFVLLRRPCGAGFLEPVSFLKVFVKIVIRDASCVSMTKFVDKVWGASTGSA